MPRPNIQRPHDGRLRTKELLSSRIRVSNLIHFWSTATKTRNPRDDRRGTIRFGSEVGQTGSSKCSFFFLFFFCRSLGLYGVVRVFLFNQHTGKSITAVEVA